MTGASSAEELRRERGTLSPAMDLTIQLDAELMGHFYEVMKIARLEGVGADRPGVKLGPRMRELITIAILAGLRSEGGLKLHMRRAMDLGADRQEIFEALQPCLVTLGAPAFLSGMAALAAVLKETGSE